MKELLEFLPFILIIIGVIASIKKGIDKSVQKVKEASKVNSEVIVEKSPEFKPMERGYTSIVPNISGGNHLNVNGSTIYNSRLSDMKPTKQIRESTEGKSSTTEVKTNDVESTEGKSISTEGKTISTEGKSLCAADKGRYMGSMGGKSNEGVPRKDRGKFVMSEVIEDKVTNATELQKIIVLGEVINVPKFKKHSIR